MNTEQAIRIAEHPKDYHYGDWWLAYDHEPKEG